MILISLAVAVNLMVIAYWTWASAHELVVGTAGAMTFVRDKGMAYTLFALPPAAALAGLARPGVLRRIGIVTNAVASIGWASSFVLSPTLTPSHALWGAFGSAAAIAVAALVAACPSDA